MTRVARCVVQCNHGARIGDAVKTGVQRDLVAQQNPGDTRPVDADLRPMHVTIGQHVPVRIVAQAQRVSQLCLVLRLANALFLLQFKRAAYDGGFTNCCARQYPTAGAARGIARGGARGTGGRH